MKGRAAAIASEAHAASNGMQNADCCNFLNYSF